MRVSLNLATRPFADLGPVLKRLRIGMAVLLLVSAVLLFGLHTFHQKAKQVRAHEQAVDAQIARLRAERTGYQALMRKPENSQVLDQAGVLNQLFDEKSFSWTLAMEDLETVLPGGVQVTTLEPARDKDGHITLKLRVLGPRDGAIRLVENLEHSRRFLSPRIVGESSDANEGPGQRFTPVTASSRVNFDVLADYNPPDPSERRTVKATATEPDAAAAGRSTATRQPHRRAPHAGGSQ